jgi:hypothetical protein
MRQQLLDVVPSPNHDLLAEAEGQSIPLRLFWREEDCQAVAAIAPEFAVVDQLPGRFQQFSGLGRTEPILRQLPLGLVQKIFEPEGILLFGVARHVGRQVDADTGGRLILQNLLQIALAKFIHHSLPLY